MYNDYMKDLEYVLEFTEIYKREVDFNIREAKCLQKQVPYILVPAQDTDLICGRMSHGYVGFSPQYGGLYTYYFHENKVVDALEKVRDTADSAFISAIEETIRFWSTEKTAYKLEKLFDEKFPERTIGRSFSEPGIANADCRVAGTNVDLYKLVNLGLNGLDEEIDLNIKKNGNSSFYEALKISVDTIRTACEIYRKQVLELLKNSDKDKKVDLENLALSLENIQTKKPNTFLEGLQLVWIYGVISDLMNYGRMDNYLGDLYVNDIEKGIITEEKAIEYLTSMYSHIKKIRKIHDARIIVGGLGRKNPENADKLAITIMETSRRVKDVIPQLTLRYYTGMNEEVYDKALKVNAEGTTFPIIYSDDTNIPAVMKVYDVTEEEAYNYTPFGCGEYVLEGLSVGTPNNGFNLLKALEVTLRNGFDPFHKVQIGPKTGNSNEFDTFEKLWDAYCKQVDLVAEQVAWHDYFNYKAVEGVGAYLHISLLMNDCIERGKSLLNGGVRYMNASSEILGMISAADSLTAIKKFVYEDKAFTLSQLVTMLDNNFEGYEKEQKMLKNAPKYGNDNSIADEMATKVYEQIAKSIIEKGKETKLNKYNIVSVNNSMSAEWGVYCVASPCGRKNGTPMANANGASIGADQSGITSLLNSMSKFNNDYHAGVINNVRFTKEMFANSYEKVKTALRVFYENNGVQTNITVIGVDDLENAKKNPEKYGNLLVRIGGFSARFVELDEVVQNEIILRTTYNS